MFQLRQVLAHFITYGLNDRHMVAVDESTMPGWEYMGFSILRNAQNYTWEVHSPWGDQAEFVLENFYLECKLTALLVSDYKL